MKFKKLSNNIELIKNMK